MTSTFTALGVTNAIQEALAALEIVQPTDIQQQAIPAMLTSKKDVVALAQTGTGKTLAFGVPLLQLIDRTNPTVQAVILVPTRELGQQIYSNIVAYAAQLPEVTAAVFYGGIPVKENIERLKAPAQIVIATPGRLIDLMERKAINISQANYLVLDEADEMVSALKDSIDVIVETMPNNRRTFLFSATMPGAVKQLIQNYLSKNPLEITAERANLASHIITHDYVVVEPIEKLDVLMHFLNSKIGERGIIFCKTKAAVNKLAKNLAINKFSSGALHGSLSQAIRDRMMGQFREGHIDILVATDLAARGIDVKEISYVVNYHLPEFYDMYVHRTGRTARAGKTGYALTVLQQEEVAEIPEFEEELGITFSAFAKASSQEIADNNLILWARKIFKTKPNRELSPELREKVHKVFHHLTKEELIDKLLARETVSK
ncbi:DEAD/DEAH box helicase [Dokdonia donghaensis]|uniref:DEAD/DEAH box helicase n=1 Tax=Dokdonia donghaensis DSW-1 TaxID=1300343 RepID=A0A0A2GR72_9FLAO|nr:DEAD/DEAH box helicase [Dokdonia donghaensis]ANH61041.1 ATP-dependent RNA helicase RhlE [Dokdonia donghaensis DSW-1]KGO05732.1 DEAD/DEAH box helicase [Dokdonia donghaensis DSW-1]